MSIPTQQKVLFLESKQGQFAVRTAEVERPGPEDVLVKVEATALNLIDWKIQTRGYLVEKFPAVLGFEAAGTVVAVGQDVTTFTMSERVAVQGWYDTAKQSTHGTFLQYYVSPARLAMKICLKIPNSLPFESATTVLSGIGTASFPLYNQAADAPSARLRAPWLAGGRNKYAGTPILILGGATTVGQFAIQLARLSGFSPILTTASLRHAEHLRSLGATHVLDRTLPAEQIKAEGIRVAGGRPFDYVYDAVSTTDTLSLAYELTAPNGTLVVVLRADHLKERDPGSEKNVYYAHGLFASAVNAEIGAGLLAALPELLESGEIKPTRTEVVPGGLNGIVQGLERLKNDQVSGVKLVVRPQETA